MLDHDQWHEAVKFDENRKSSSHRDVRRKLCSLLKRAGIYKHETIASTIIYNFDKNYRSAWYLPSRAYSVAGKSYPAPSRVWRKVFSILEREGLLERFKSGNRDKCDRFRFTVKFASLFKLKAAKLSFQPYKIVNNKRVGATYSRFSFWPAYSSLLKKYVITTDRRHISVINFAMNITEDGCNGRLTAGYQSIAKTERRTLCFNGEVSAEIDLVGAHLQLLYASCGLELLNDPYSIDLNVPWLASHQIRAIAKKALFVIINTGDRSRAVSSLSGFTNDEDAKLLFERTFQSYCQFFNVTDSDRSTHLIYFMQWMNDIVLATVNRHKEVLDSVSSGKLFWMESELLIRWIAALANNGIPSLPIHDAVLVPISSVDVATEILIDQWNNLFPTAQEVQFQIKLPDAA